MSTTAVPYHEIAETFWDDALRLGWSREATLLATYVLTSPHRPQATTEYHLPRAMIADDLTWSLAKVCEALGELIDSGFVEYGDGEILRFRGSGKGAL